MISSSRLSPRFSAGEEPGYEATSADILFILSFSAPTPPRMFQITSVMTRGLSFSWQAPVTLNGVLTGYQLSCQPLLPDIPSPQPLPPRDTAVMAILSGLYPGVGYNCSLEARNGAGSSDPVYISNTTLETGMHFFAKLYGLQLVKWGSLENAEKMWATYQELSACC